jgi:hypothetical protein
VGRELTKTMRESQKICVLALGTYSPCLSASAAESNQFGALEGEGGDLLWTDLHIIEREILSEFLASPEHFTPGEQLFLHNGPINPFYRIA